MQMSESRIKIVDNLSYELMKISLQPPSGNFLFKFTLFNTKNLRSGSLLFKFKIFNLKF
jgi:hypothetical protein